MGPERPHPMSEHLAWAQWWAFPWRYSHADWKAIVTPSALNTFYDSRGTISSPISGILPCLPSTPNSAVLQLVMASTEQLSLVLALAHNILSPATAARPSESDQVWCIRFARALPPGIALPDDDPLQLLRTCVEPATWQRLRLRFPYERVVRLEQKPVDINNRHNRLDTFWQAVVWRVTANAAGVIDQGIEEYTDALQT